MCTDNHTPTYGNFNRGLLPCTLLLCYNLCSSLTTVLQNLMGRRKSHFLGNPLPDGPGHNQRLKLLGRCYQPARGLVSVVEGVLLDCRNTIFYNTMGRLFFCSKFDEKEVRKLELLTVDDVAKMLQKSVGAVMMHRLRGNLPASIKIGRCIYWEKNQLERFLNRKRENGKKEHK